MLSNEIKAMDYHVRIGNNRRICKIVLIIDMVHTGNDKEWYGWNTPYPIKDLIGLGLQFL